MDEKDAVHMGKDITPLLQCFASGAVGLVGEALRVSFEVDEIREKARQAVKEGRAANPAWLIPLYCDLEGMGRRQAA